MYFTHPFPRKMDACIWPALRERRAGVARDYHPFARVRGFCERGQVITAPENKFLDHCSQNDFLLAAQYLFSITAFLKGSRGSISGAIRRSSLLHYLSFYQTHFSGVTYNRPTRTFYWKVKEFLRESVTLVSMLVPVTVLFQVQSVYPRHNL